MPNRPVAPVEYAEAAIKNEANYTSNPTANSHLKMAVS
jgi:hypothetical protein